jgi:hypothetical protein
MVSTLGLKCGYWQVAVNPSNKERTVFSTGQGMEQLIIMPSGHCRIPAMFEQLMESVLQGHELRSLLGLCTYYWRFMAGFTYAANLLTQLTKEKEVLQWSPESGAALQSM